MRPLRAGRRPRGRACRQQLLNTHLKPCLTVRARQGETGEEVANIARTLRARSVPVDAGVDTLDIVGTGGDGIGSVNISTGSCVIAAAAGAHVAKHGSRSVSSLCGSADVLEVHPAAASPTLLAFFFNEQSKGVQPVRQRGGFAPSCGSACF